MMTNKLKQISCPTCSKKETWNPENPFRPFCSDRCKLIDLGEWAEGNRRVPGEPANPQELPDDESE